MCVRVCMCVLRRARTCVSVCARACGGGGVAGGAGVVCWCHLRRCECVVVGGCVGVVVVVAPNLSGIESSDAARVQHLIELAVEFAQNHMKPQGALVVKVFHGSGYSQIVKMFKATFKVVKPIKPKASRDKSSETFLVGIGLADPI